MNSATKRFLGTMALLAVLGIILGLAQKNVVRPQPQVVLGGMTMGTSWQVKVVGVNESDSFVSGLQSLLEDELTALNAEMSTYLADSDIRRFNAAPAGKKIAVNENFLKVLELSRQVWTHSGGAFEPTLDPLINLWGFDYAEGLDVLPSDQALREVLTRVGLEKVEREAAEVWKTTEGVQLNFSAVAKGYAVDRLLFLIQAAGFGNAYVEIGGEVRCAGVNALGTPWRIGVQVPVSDAGQIGQAIRVVALSDRALATSGDYRNFREIDGQLVAHILDPRTGRPVRHQLASVSVLAKSCSAADALATALYVAGPEEGMRLALALPDVEALFVERDAAGEFVTVATPGFEQALLSEGE